MTKPGDRVKIITSEQDITGILMPEEKEFIVLKMDTGYNIGIDKKRVREISLLSHPSKKETEIPKAQPKPGLPKISILHTGGTIASKVDYSTGGVVAQFEPEKILEMFPELREIANIDSRLICNIMSENIRFGHYNIIAHEIKKEIEKGAEGIIITQGTDTIHYTGAALSFMLSDLGIPVIIVGAQRSSDRGSSDAALNLLSAALFITASKSFSGVAVCMHETEEDTTCLILPGTKCRKMHSSRRDAFKPINSEPWARIDFKKRKVDYMRTDFIKRSAKIPEIREFKENLEIGILKTYPNMFADAVLAFKKYDGLIIEGTGLGHAPIMEIDSLTKEHTKIYSAIKELIDNDTIVALTTQTIYGEINMNVYSPGRKLLDIGILGNYSDMTTETAFIKLAWLLSNYPKHKVCEMFSKNLTGEISKRLER
ncbi:Glu-tRNA(Gln) amidotransferase subunit GatD [Candidatus Woesearchaeota archaeon]|nr:Glu-tRNA(Gln) amidotransferase subunit GatD [Candidatus Woesearchaeota archaeon]MBW2978638.1 Glu-tRNA(Gln) amidotransferase subunit GatD [Candidatus Woesearchaeota archaeon]